MADDRSAAILTFPSRTVDVEYDEERRLRAFKRTFKLGWRRVQRRFVIRALPVRQLHDLNAILERLITARGGLDLVEACTVIVGQPVRALPQRALQAVYDAYLEVNELNPKAEPPASPSPSETSSGGSSDGPSTSASTTPPA